MIDFGDAGTGDPTWDSTVVTRRRPDLVPILLDAYGAGTEMRERTARVLPAYQTLRLLAEVIWLHDRGLDTSEATRATGDHPRNSPRPM